MNMRECYAAMGADYDDVIRRLGSEERMRKFLSMVLKDSSYDMLCSAMEEKNIEEAFRAAHTLKGVCMNLGLSRLGNSSSQLTESLRGDRSNERTESFYQQVRMDYDEVINAIQTLLNS